MHRVPHRCSQGVRVNARPPPRALTRPPPRATAFAPLFDRTASSVDGYACGHPCHMDRAATTDRGDLTGPHHDVSGCRHASFGMRSLLQESPHHQPQCSRAAHLLGPPCIPASNAARRPRGAVRPARWRGVPLTPGDGRRRLDICRPPAVQIDCGLAGWLQRSRISRVAASPRGAVRAAASLWRVTRVDAVNCCRLPSEVQASTQAAAPF